MFLSREKRRRMRNSFMFRGGDNIFMLWIRRRLNFPYAASKQRKIRGKSMKTCCRNARLAFTVRICPRNFAFRFDDKFSGFRNNRTWITPIFSRILISHKFCVKNFSLDQTVFVGNSFPHATSNSIISTVELASKMEQ